MILVLLMFAGCCALGAALRYVADTLLPSHGILLVNVLGSLIAGAVFAAVWGAGASESTTIFLATGLAGSLTTFSTVSLAAGKALLERRYRTTLSTLLLHYGASLTAATLGCLAIAWLTSTAM